MYTNVVAFILVKITTEHGFPISRPIHQMLNIICSKIIQESTDKKKEIMVREFDLITGEINNNHLFQ